MLLALGNHAPVRDLLLRVFAAQNPDGDWPQWFMFFERERNIRPNDSHGDIVFWPVLALARYLLASDDVSILDAVVPFFHPDQPAAENASVWDHVERALAVMTARVIPGTHLAAYGHGDWNDSLQPVDPAMRERLCSAWTVTLQHETLTTLVAALQHHRPARARQLETQAASIRTDFQRSLVIDGVLTGFAYFHEEAIDYLLHPRDDSTGIHYRLLPMIHAILNGLLTPRQAQRHVALIKKRLLAPDGARLFDRPPRYQGGPQRHFQRAESSTFFGREIGIMYMHAHLRYAQAMAYYGDAESFFLALRQANPMALDATVPTARPRQVNCYYSSSDAAFDDRYDAAARYAQLRKGKIAFEGGWRIYSSGAGIMVRLIHECLLGLRRHASMLHIDPVIPKALSGLRAEIDLAGAPVTMVYRVESAGCGVKTLTLNDATLPFAREANPYRTGAAVVAMHDLRERLRSSANTLVAQLD
jgi:cellobiose phosphorylase